MHLNLFQIYGEYDKGDNSDAIAFNHASIFMQLATSRRLFLLYQLHRVQSQGR